MSIVLKILMTLGPLVLESWLSPLLHPTAVKDSYMRLLMVNQGLNFECVAIPMDKWTYQRTYLSRYDSLSF